MTAEEAAEIVRMALWEAGYPDALVRVMTTRTVGSPLGVVVRKDVPRHVSHRAFALLYHARREPFPEYDEWDAWRQLNPRPPSWWHVPYDLPVVVS